MASDRVWFSAPDEWRRFVLGPGAAALFVGWFVTLNPPDFAHPSQAAALQVAVAPSLKRQRPSSRS